MWKKILTMISFLSLLVTPALADSLILGYTPYIEPSVTTYVRGAYLDTDDNMILNATLLFELGGSNYSMSYNETSNAYEVTVMYNPTDVGNWTFKVYANKTGYETSVENGTHKVRNPIYVNVRLFEDTNSTSYTDEQAQVIMKGSYSCIPFVTRTETNVFGDTVYYTDCYFHANYTSGVAIVKVYEYGPYVTSFISASNFIYANAFAYPTIERQNYAFTLGTFTVDQSPETIDIVMTSCELNPEQCQRFYLSMFLWIVFLVIAGAGGLIAGKWTGSGGVAVSTGIIIMIGLVLLRLALLGY